LSEHQKLRHPEALSNTAPQQITQVVEQSLSQTNYPDIQELPQHQLAPINYMNNITQSTDGIINLRESAEDTEFFEHTDERMQEKYMRVNLDRTDENEYQNYYRQSHNTSEPQYIYNDSRDYKFTRTSPPRDNHLPRRNTNNSHRNDGRIGTQRSMRGGNFKPHSNSRNYPRNNNRNEQPIHRRNELDRDYHNTNTNKGNSYQTRGNKYNNR